MAITAIVTLALFTLVGQSTASYAEAKRSVNSLSQARAFLQFFERELSTRLPLTPLLHEPSTPGGAEASSKIAFIRSLSHDEQSQLTPGDLGTSAYYVAFTADSPNTVSPKLFRKFLNSAETQSLLESPTQPDFPAPAPTTDEAIIYHVLDFDASPKFLNPSTGELFDWNPDSPEPPTSLELTIRFTDESTAQRFTTAADWDRLATNPRENERKLIRTYSRSIPINR